VAFVLRLGLLKSRLSTQVAIIAEKPIDIAYIFESILVVYSPILLGGGKT
jgi:hypothetical protein